MKLWIEKELFQWEQERYVNVNLNDSDTEVTFIQFYNDANKEGPKVSLKNNKAKIPDYLLEKSLPIMAVACTGSEGSIQVITRKQFKVVKRAKPTDLIENDRHVIYDGGEEI